jgi:hypothetical protein
MKLSEKTVSILKNFSTINQGIQIKPGNEIRTVSKQRNVLAKATVPDSFTDEIILYDLNQFLGVITSLDNPDISVISKDEESKKAVVKSGDIKVVYGLSSENLIVAPPVKDLKVENAEVNFTLSESNVNSILKFAGILGLENIVAVGDGKNVSFSSMNTKDNDTNTTSIVVGPTDKKFKFIFNTENFKMIPGTYDVSINAKGLSHFKNTKDPVEYWIATEAGSKYGE